MAALRSGPKQVWVSPAPSVRARRRRAPRAAIPRPDLAGARRIPGDGEQAPAERTGAHVARQSRSCTRGRLALLWIASLDMSWQEADRAVLLRLLSSQREHILAQLNGLTEAQLRSTVLPSGWTPLGLVRHLTLSDERYWFAVVVGGAALDYWPEGANADWHISPEEATSDVLDAYRAAIARSDEIIGERRLDDPPARPEQWWADAGLAFPDLRSVVLHVIVETATHAGHLDVARELIDGRQHLVL